MQREDLKGMSMEKDLKKVKLLVIDVDGTMTDAGIYYDEHGNELKKFCTKDAAGFFAAHQVGIEIMVLTGRECAATTRRMTEIKLGVTVVCRVALHGHAAIRQYGDCANTDHIQCAVGGIVVHKDNLQRARRLCRHALEGAPHDGRAVVDGYGYCDLAFHLLQI